MADAQIHTGDILIVDRSMEPIHNRIVVAILNGEFTVKRLYKKDNELMLLPENDAFQPIVITPETDFEVWGVVSWIIHKAK